MVAFRRAHSATTSKSMDEQAQYSLHRRVDRPLSQTKHGETAKQQHKRAQQKRASKTPSRRKQHTKVQQTRTTQTHKHGQPPFGGLSSRLPRTAPLQSALPAHVCACRVCFAAHLCAHAQRCQLDCNGSIMFHSASTLALPTLSQPIRQHASIRRPSPTIRRGSRSAPNGRG